MEIKEIQNLIKFVARSGASEVKLETKDFKITIKTGTERDDVAEIQHIPVVAPVETVTQVVSASQPAAKVETPSQGAAEKSKFLTIKSPIIGTFYRKSSPESPPFVKVGDRVSVGDTVCIIEAMKLFNEVESEVSGTIVEILVDDSSPVEFDQPLYLVDPS
ncbi:acetyl-CoA carboxylase biotin carboxyl carrier protein [Namhaeicola litoreus]|uniref:Biotin carboxyl carrier protein of acetyl-CoA carboxylase n=1 Tax=Namhaeicola litoreus TaxID=1052145 RepID=A0ABW3Y061_9FLAO